MSGRKMALLLIYAMYSTKAQAAPCEKFLTETKKAMNPTSIQQQALQALSSAQISVEYTGEIVSQTMLGKPNVAVSIDKTPVAHYILSSVSDHSIAFEQNITDNSLNSEIVVASLIKSLLGRLKLEPWQSNIEIIVFADAVYKEAYEAFGFTYKNNAFVLTLSAADTNLLRNLKTSLLEKISNATKVGRGYLVDTTLYSKKAIELLMKEYNEIAWGYGGWARHASIAKDELMLISDLKDDKATVVEIGSGSGRLTKALSQHFKKIIATDYSEQIIESLEKTLLNEGFKNISPTYDNIISSKLADNTFDKVLFLENGLGALLDINDRQAAINNMARILKPNGQLVLGIRSLGESSDHLMPASQNQIFMGIYRTFSTDEITELAPKNLKLRKVIQGDSRPAGGHQIFFIFEKNE